jgi:Phage integrase, N-terminal SAM-like domain
VKPGNGRPRVSATRLDRARRASHGKCDETATSSRGIWPAKRPGIQAGRSSSAGSEIITSFRALREANLSCRVWPSRGPVSSDVPKLAEFLDYWLRDIVKPNLAPKTYEKYEMFSRLHIIPHLGGKRLDKVQVKDIRQWLNKLAVLCQCCAQGKDSVRPEGKRRCCVVGKCCQQTLSARSRKDARDTLRAALTCAVEGRDNRPQSRHRRQDDQTSRTETASQAKDVDR